MNVMSLKKFSEGGVILSHRGLYLMVFLAYNHREGWWKGMKQFLPAKSVEHEETPVRYSSSEVNHLSPREVTTMLQTDSAGNCGLGAGEEDPAAGSCEVLWDLRGLLAFPYVGDELSA